MRRAVARGLARVAAAVAVIALAACATPSLPEIAPDLSPDAFSRVGRFAITVTHDDGKTEAVQGGFAWRDDGRRYQLDLTNPLGSTEARVQGRPGSALLLRADGSRLRAGDPDALVEDALGSPVPVGGLRDWLRGRLMATQANDLKRDSQGRPESFDQDGWRARLSRYDAQGPRLLVLRREEARRAISVRLVVDTSDPS
ncbi:lipoprotein insertase outer membrane protein LolB [Bordetella sp.]|uniref:lipoprotein insertase outer membrane protein LolB n=1 Tax=Bordetella sp. TaxID=28081 RepID=UPI0039C8BD93